MFIRLTDLISVAPQIAPEDCAAARTQGFVSIVNNRPDGEEVGQPEGDAVRAAAEGAGLAYTAIPVTGAGFSLPQVDAMAAAIDAAGGPVLAYCRSGTRSIVTWSIGQAMSGARPRGELVDLGRGAGYELEPVLGS